MPLTGSVNISQCRRSKYVTGELDHQVSADRVRVGPQVVGLGSHADHVIGAVDRSSEGRPGGAVRIQHRRLQRVSCQLDGHASREEIEADYAPGGLVNRMYPTYEPRDEQIAGKLGNAEFRANAPADVVAKDEARAAELRSEIQQLDAQRGRVERAEMEQTFNMGVGMVLIVAPEHVGAVQESIAERTWIIGELVAGERQVHLHR